LPSDSGSGVPAATAPAGAIVDAARNSRIPFELLAAIAIVGAAANGRLAESALVGIVFALGHLLNARSRAIPVLGALVPSGRGDEGSDAPAARDNARHAERALAMFTAWFMPLCLALAAAVLMRNADVMFALTLLLVASPQPLLALPASSRSTARALAAVASATLLAAALAGFVGLVAAAVLQQVSMFVARGLASRPVRARDQQPT